MQRTPTLCGRFVAAARRVMEMDDVLEARMAWMGVICMQVAGRSCLRLPAAVEAACHAPMLGIRSAGNHSCMPAADNAGALDLLALCTQRCIDGAHAMP